MGQEFPTSKKQVGHETSTSRRISYSENLIIWSKSSKTAIDDILEALSKYGTERIGVCGIVGCGKTWLVREVARKAEERSLFDHILFLSASSTPDIRKLPSQMADQLGYTVSEMRMNTSRTLVILDDIRKPLSLKDIGIGNVKLIFTSRSRLVCNNIKMGCQKILYLYLWDKDDAWKLFQVHARIHDNVSSTDLQLAKEIANKCKGLPLAIVAVARSLEGKPYSTWRRALRGWEVSCLPEEMTMDHIYVALMYTCSSLSNQEKMLFLGCCLFSESYHITIQDLVNIAIRMKLWDTEDHAKIIVKDLIMSNMLMMPCNSDMGGEFVMVHDLVRDVGLHIVSQEDPTKMAKYADCVKELIENKKSSTVLVKPVFGNENNNLGETLKVPCGKMVDFGGLCLVNECFLPLLREACERTPQLMKIHEGHSSMFRQCAFNCLGRVLFLTKNVTNIKDMVQYVDKLRMYWEDLKIMKLDLEWLSPTVERALLSSVLLPEADRMRKLQEQVNNWSAQDTKLREELRVVQDKIVVARKEIALIQSKFTDLGVADLSKYFMQ